MAGPGLLRAQLHAPFEDRTCTACHATGPTPPAPAVEKDGGLARCVDCHDFSGVTKAKKGHPLARRGECFGCHAPHAADRPKLLRDGGAALCARCHDLRAKSLEASHAAGVLAPGDCLRCHPAHPGMKP